MYSSERHFQREGSASLVPLSHTLKKKKGGRCDENALYSKQFSELPYQTNPLSFCQTNSGERAGDKEMKGGKEDTKVNRGSTERRRSDESCSDCVTAFMIAATVRGTVTNTGLRGFVGYTGTRTFAAPSIKT